MNKVRLLLMSIMGMFLMMGASVRAETYGDYQYTIENGSITINRYTGNDTNIVIPSSINGYPVIIIGEDAFETRDLIKSISIPNSVERIKKRAFLNCDSLESIIIPNSVKSIEAAAFSSCDNLINISIPNSVTTIENSTFYACQKLAGITLPNSIISIGDRAFESCFSLEEITIPSSVTTIGKSVFRSCNALESINVSDNNSNYSSQEGILFNKNKSTLIVCPNGKKGSCIIPNCVTSIGGSAFGYCSKITEIIIPNGVTSIGQSAFDGCSRLENITIPNTVTTIENHTFFACTCLSSITIPYGVTSIGNYAFWNCNNLSEIIIPASVKSIGDCAFANRPDHLNIRFEGNAPLFGNNVFLNVTTTAHYPSNNPTWTEDVRQNYGGNLTWTPYSSDDPDDPTPEDSDIEFIGAFHNGIVDLLYPKSATISAMIPNGSNLEEGDVSWEIRDRNVARIIDTAFFVEGNNAYAGVTIKCVGEGTSVLELNLSDSRKKTKSIIGYKPSTTGVFVSTSTGEMSERTIRSGLSLQLLATVYPAELLDPRVTWSSSNIDIATVDQNGVVSTKSEGQVIIYAKSGDKIGSIKLNVLDNSYELFTYSFINSREDFGYTDEFMIPPKRYMQLGFSEADANAHQSTWHGNCFGMTTSSILFYMDVMKEEDYINFIHLPTDFAKPGDYSGEDEKLKLMIELLQIAFELLPEEDKHSVYNSTLPLLLDQLDRGIPVSLFIASWYPFKEAGHELVLYSYEKNGNILRFDLYDCSRFVDHLTYDYTNDEWSFYPYVHQDDERIYKWEPYKFITFESLLKIYNKIKSENHDNASSLLSRKRLTRDTGDKFIMHLPARDTLLRNKEGQQTEINKGHYTGNISDLQLSFRGGYLSDNAEYVISVPINDYTITGPGSVSVSNGVISVVISTEDGKAISLSEDLHSIVLNIEEGTAFSIEYTTYDNVYDKMVISGISSGTVTVNLNSDYKEVDVSGVKTISVTTTVGEAESQTSTDLNGQNAIIQIIELGGGFSLQIVTNEELLSDRVELPEREKLSLPQYDLPSGSYSTGQVLSFEEDNDTLIYYTVDGSDPTETNGLLYTLPITINKSMTVKAMAKRYGYKDSDILTLVYTLPQVEVPLPTYAEGSYDTVIYLDLNVDDSDTTIFYTINGENPFEEGIRYTSSIVMMENTLVSAYAEKNGCVSEMVNYYYQVNPKDKFIIVNTPVNQDGDPIVAENVSSTESVSLNVISPSRTEQNGHFVVAFYDDAGDLVAFEEQDAIIPEEGSNITFQISQDISSAAIMEVYLDEYMVVVKNGYGTGHYSTNDSVYITAHHKENKEFSNWIGVENISFIAGNDTSDKVVFIMPEMSIVLTAKYIIDEDYRCGDDLTWTLEEGILTISGTGAMWDFDENETPWYDDRETISQVIIEEGVASIGNSAFTGCTALAEATIPSSVILIGENAFLDSSLLTSVDYTGSEAQWEDVEINSGNEILGTAAITYGLLSIRTSDDITNGTVMPSTKGAKEGDLVTLAAEPEEGYKLVEDSLTVTYVDENSETQTVDINEDGSFNMPSYDVMVNASFEVLSECDLNGHDWGDIQYTWSEDNSTVTAKRTCLRGECGKVEAETVGTTAEVTKEATTAAMGETTYTSDPFVNPAFEVQTKTVCDIPPLFDETAAGNVVVTDASGQVLSSYKDLAMAVSRFNTNSGSSIGSGSTFWMTKDVDLSSPISFGDVSGSIIKQVTLDLNGHTITNSGVPSGKNEYVLLLNRNCVCTIKDYVGNGKIINSSTGQDAQCVVRSRSLLKIMGGALIGPSSDDSGHTRTALFTEGGTTTAISGTAQIGDGNSMYGIYNQGSSSIIISGGTVLGSASGIYSTTMTGLTMTGGSVSGRDNYGIFINASDSNKNGIRISDGTITGGEKALYVSTGCDMDSISGGKFQGEIEAQDGLNGKVTGGLFDLAVPEAYIAEGYELQQNPDTSTQTEYPFMVCQAEGEHSWGKATYEWSEDNSTVTATRVCSNNPSHEESETVDTKIALEQAPTDDEMGITIYTAVFENSAFVVQKRSVEDIPALKDLSTIVLPSGLVEIEEEAFSGLDCEAVIIPDGCTSIGSRAFAACEKLIYVRIPASVTNIPEDAFEGSDQVRIDQIS